MPTYRYDGPEPWVSAGGRKWHKGVARTVGQLQEEHAHEMAQAGVKEIHASQPEAPITPAVSDPLEEMTVSELRNVARERGMTGFSTLSKSELLRFLKND